MSSVQSPETIRKMMKDLIQYIIMPKVRHAPDIGTYASYDIAAIDILKGGIAAIVWDVTPDRDLALRMVGQFNQIQLDPKLLEEAVLNMLQ